MFVAPLVSCRGVRKRFGHMEVLRGIDLAIREGENYGLLGPNGSGKTTLIRILAGVLRADSGEVKVGGLTLPSRQAAAFTGYMTQASALYEDLTVMENVTFFAKLYGLRGNVASRVAEVLELVHLADRAKSLVRVLSGGMRQRVNLACALVHRPRLLLLDEPTVGVDPKLRQGLWEYFHQLNREGVTLIVSTHIMDEAERCSRVGMLRAGRVLAEGTPAELKERAEKSSLEDAFLAFVEESVKDGGHMDAL